MATQASEINAVVGLPDEHPFGFDYLQRFPIVNRIYHVPVMYSIGLGTQVIGSG